MITVTPIELLAEDERGTTYIFDSDRTGEFLIAYRKAGSVSGRHYHKGISANKNPEKLILMSGEVTINWFHVNGEGKGTLKAKAPSWIIIETNTWHEVIADTDFVMYELNSRADGNRDTYRDA